MTPPEFLLNDHEELQPVSPKAMTVMFQSLPDRLAVA